MTNSADHDPAKLGRARALTTLSPVLPKRHGKLALALRLVRLIPNAGRPLQELAFIHYGRWTVLRDLPNADGRGRPPLRLNSRYLLFESNFDGTEEDYLDAFAFTLPHRLERLWGNCVAFKSRVVTQAVPGTTAHTITPYRFRAYVEDNRLEVLHFYAAYPDHTVQHIRAAFALHDRERRPAFSRGAARRRSAECAALALGPAPAGIGLPRRAARIVADWLAAVSGRHGVKPLTLITPLPQGEAAIEYLRATPGTASPLASVDGTHYARFVLLGPKLTNLGQRSPDELPTAYLLFTSNYHGRHDRYVEAIRSQMADAADRIWGGCPGYPGAADRAGFVKWFERHERKTDYFVAGYPARPTADIDRLVTHRRQRAEEILAGVSQ